MTPQRSYVNSSSPCRCAISPYLPHLLPSPHLPSTQPFHHTFSDLRLSPVTAAQDLTAERDEAKAALSTIRERHEGGEEGAELARLRNENFALRAENANM